MDTQVGFRNIGYAPPRNRFERWREQTWPQWATRLWPIRRGAVVPITYDEHATVDRVYFLSADGPYVLDGTGRQDLTGR